MRSVTRNATLRAGPYATRRDAPVRSEMTVNEITPMNVGIASTVSLLRARACDFCARRVRLERVLFNNRVEPSFGSHRGWMGIVMSEHKGYVHTSTIKLL